MAEANQPSFPDPLETQLDTIELQGDNSLRVTFLLDGGEALAIELMPESEEMARLLDLIAELATAKLHRIGNRGVRIGAMTSWEAE